jgi:hypothetical protein
MSTYGTVVIGTLKDGVKPSQVIEVTRDWLAQRAPAVSGFIDNWVLVADDGSTIVAGARFASKADYDKLGDDPAQDAWYQAHYAPAFDGELRWVDGVVHVSAEDFR